MSNPYDVWGISKDVAEESSKIFRMKHGLFAGVPIICREGLCPYIKVCTVDKTKRVVGSRCPMEAGAIVSRFESWCRHFEINIEGNRIKDEDLADVSLIKDLVENEIQTLRAENRIALNADFIGKTIVEIDNKGKVYRENTVTPEAEFKLSLQEKRYKILQLLNATRKDKSKNDPNVSSPSNRAISIFNKVAEKLTRNIDDIDFTKIAEGSGDKNGEC